MTSFTKLCRMTSFSSSLTIPIPLISPKINNASFNPEITRRGKSICRDHHDNKFSTDPCIKTFSSEHG